MRTAGLIVLCILLSCGYQPPVQYAPRGVPSGVLARTLRLFQGSRQICSAVLVGPRLALGAAHCFASSGTYTVFRDRDGAARRAERTHWNGGLDLAELELDHDMPGPYAAIGEIPYPGQAAWITGYGCGKREATGPTLEARRLHVLRSGGGLESNYAGLACAGDSGGGVWSLDGKLIGIVHSRTTVGPHQVYASDVGAPLLSL